MRNIPESFDPEVVTAIDGRLCGVEAEHDVRIMLAIESGSRAWGFASPDSDYDCRFIFVRPTEHHLSPWPRRDVIETPLDAVLDVNGWELGKALKLVLKGNAVIIEWLMSPVAYRGDIGFRDELLAFAEQFAERRLIGRHYLHLGERQRRTYFADSKQVALKKIFYALRPAAALRWLRLHPEARIAPMNFHQLINECDPSADIAASVSTLLAEKAGSRELGIGEVPSDLLAFIDTEFTIARDHFETGFIRPSAEARTRADALVRRYAYWREVSPTRGF